jgi:membrane-associated phospholipid phosphatase
MDANLASFDITILNWLNHHLIPHSVPVLSAVSHITTYISIVAVLIVLLLWVIRRSKPILRKFFILATVLILVLIVSQGLKSLIYKDRPFDTYPFIEKLADGGGSSFPSGHTLEAFAMATVFSLLFRRKKIVIAAFIWAILVAYSWMALGVHYPSNVLGGCLIGMFLGWVVPWIFNRVRAARERNG